MPEFRLPRIKTLDRIVDALGRPTAAFVKYFNNDFAGAIERNEAAQAAILADIVEINERQDQADLDLQEQIDRINDLLSGALAFTGLNVGGTDVRPFLDKTDGAKLTDSTGLDGSVVVTNTLNSGAANQTITTSGATTALPAGVSTVVLSIAVTTIAGEVVDLSSQFSNLEISDASAAPFLVGRWTRNGSPLFPVAVVRGIDVTRSANATRYVLAEGSMTIVANDIPGAGTHTYELVAQSSVTTGALAPYGRLLTSTRP